MKTKIFILSVIVTISANAQYSYEYQSTTVKTPTGISVDALQFKSWVYNDFTLSEQQAEDYQYTNNYNCTIIASSTKYYNCHGYAWHNIEGNMAQNKLRWIDDINDYGNPTYNVHRYHSATYSNGKPSYKEVSINNKANLKVSYFPRDHSAVTTSNPQKFISKWAWGPLVEHAPNQCPFYYNAQIKYYEAIPLYTISGPTNICWGEAIYTIEGFDDLPEGTTVQ